MQPEPASAMMERAETIEELFAALESPLLGYALRLAGERGVAEDLVQEAFMRLHKQFAEVRDPRRWLYRTVHNLAMNQRRDSSKIVPMDPRGTKEGDRGENLPDPQLHPDEELARVERIGMVQSSVAALGGKSRELLRLKFTEDLSYKEIGERLGLTAGNVGFQLHHLLKGLGDELARKGILR
ncbi:MAG: sigma-70 family RNA polymerase sigma factor [Verrucomicrobiota bacterium]